MAVHPAVPRSLEGRGRLESFRRSDAERVAAWVRSDAEAFWLAPATQTPITARRVLEWHGTGREPLLLHARDCREPVAYGELNVLHGRRGYYWLGHLLVDPARRGQGFGTLLTRLLLWRAFRQKKAQRVTLVVFPENAIAIASYRAAGFRPDGHEEHHFPLYGGKIRLHRMVARRDDLPPA